MKTVILLYLFFAIELSLAALIQANFNLELVTTSNFQTWKSTTFGQKLGSEKHFIDKANKIVNNDTPTPVEERFGTKENLHNIEIPTIESELGYQAIQENKKLRELPRRLNLPTIQQNVNYLQELMNDEHGKKEFYLNSYNPSSHRSTHFSNFGRNLYPNTYGIRNFDKRLMNRKRHPKILLEVQDDKLEETEPLSKKKGTFPMFPNQNDGSEEEIPLSMFPNQDGMSGEENVPSDKKEIVLSMFPNPNGMSGVEDVAPYKEESPLSMFANQTGRSEEVNVSHYKEESPLSMFLNQNGRSGSGVENVPPYKKESPLSMFPNKVGRSAKENVLSYKEESPLSMFSNQDGQSGAENFPPYKKESTLLMFPNQNGRSGVENVPSFKEESPLSVFPNKVGRSAEENELSYKEESAHVSKDTPFISMPAASNINEKLQNILGITALRANGTVGNSFIKSSEESGIEKRFLKRSNSNFRNINQMTSRLNKIVTRSKNSETDQFKKQEMKKLNVPKSDKTETFRTPSEFLDFSKTNEKEEKNESPFHIIQLRFGRNSTQDYIKDGKLNKLLYNRVYFEKMPENPDFPWFVYVNCSRDKCLLTNNTDESELRSEGWILHNCTNDGCVEMHPRIESTWKFIGLILLVFGLCVLKTVIFLLIFYYYRKMRRSRKAPTDPDLNGEKSIIGEKKSLEKNHDNDRNKEVITEKFEPKPSYQKDIYSNKGKKPNSLITQEAEKDDSKVWVPPYQYVGLCLMNTAPNKNILIPKKSFEKKVHDSKISAIPKCKKSYRSSIPRLERWKKGNVGRPAKVETKKGGHDLDWKPSNRTKETPDRDADILLMNLDVEEDNGLYMPEQIEKTPKWSTLLDNECKSFVSIDLGESKM